MHMHVLIQYTKKPGYFYIDNMLRNMNTHYYNKFLSSWES